MAAAELPADELLTVVVTGFGYAITHAASIPAALLEPMAWPSPRYPFTGLRSPVAAICGITVKSVQPCVIVMDIRPQLPGNVRITCRTCRRMVDLGLVAPVTYPKVHEDTPHN